MGRTRPPDDHQFRGARAAGIAWACSPDRGATRWHVTPAASAVRRQEHDLGSLSRRAPDRELGPDLTGPFSHAQQAPVPAVSVKIGLHREPAPVIVDRKPNLPGAINQTDSYPPRLSLLHGVRDRFLHHPENRGRDLRIQAPRQALAPELE